MTARYGWSPSGEADTELSSCVVVMLRGDPTVYGPYTYRQANVVLWEVRNKWPEVESHRSPLIPWTEEGTSS